MPVAVGVVAAAAVAAVVAVAAAVPLAVADTAAAPAVAAAGLRAAPAAEGFGSGAVDGVAGMVAVAWAVARKVETRLPPAPPVSAALVRRGAARPAA